MTDISKVGFEADTSGLNQAEAAVDKLTAKVQALNEQLEKTNQAGAQASAGLEKVKTSQQSIAGAPAIKVIPDDLSSKIADAASKTTQLAATIESAASRSAAIKNVSTNLGEVATRAESTNSSAAKLVSTLAAIGPISVGGRIGADLQGIGSTAEASGSSVKKFADSLSGIATAAISGSNLRTAATDITDVGRQSEATSSSVSKLADGFRGLGSFASGGSFKGVSGELKSLEGEATSSASSLGKMTNSVESLAEKFVVVGAATGQLVSGFEGVSDGASSVTEQLSKVGEATEGVKSIWEGVKSAFESFTSSFKDGFQGAVTEANNAATGMESSFDRIATSIKRRNPGLSIDEIKSKLTSAKVEANAFAAASAGVAAGTAEAGLAAAGAGGAIEGVASAVSHGASAAHGAKAAHEGLSISMHELHGVASALEVPLSQMGVHLGEVTRISGAARLGIAGIGAAIAGGLAVYLAKLDEDTERAKQRLEGLSGVKMGDEYFNQVQKLDKELGTTSHSVQPALESLIKLKNAAQDLHGVQVITPGSASQLDQTRLSAEALAQSIAAVTMQFKLGGANAEEASKGVNDFFAAAVKSNGVTGNMLRQLENGSQGGQKFAQALTNAFKGGAMNADQFAAELDRVPLSLSSLLGMLPFLASASRSAFEEMERHPTTLSGVVDKLGEVLPRPLGNDDRGRGQGRGRGRNPERDRRRHPRG
jgi:archaellum component FlaC